MSEDHEASIPAGFKPVPMGGPFVAANGPFCVYQHEGSAKLGLRIEQRHCNTMGHCHGGMLSTFVDMMMPVAMNNHAEVAARKRFLPTVSLQLDFIAPVLKGDWLEGEAQVLKATRSLVFVQGLVRVGRQVVLRCSGVYKIAMEIPQGSPGMYTDEALPAPPRRPDK